MGMIAGGSAEVAALIEAAGSTVTLFDNSTVKGILGQSRDKAIALFGVERVARIEDGGGRAETLYLAGDSYNRDKFTKPFTLLGDTWTMHDKRLIADGDEIQAVHLLIAVGDINAQRE